MKGHTMFHPIKKLDKHIDPELRAYATVYAAAATTAVAGAAAVVYGAVKVAQHVSN